MKASFITRSLFNLLIVCVNTSVHAQYNWFKTGSAKDDYVMRIDSVNTHNNNYVFTLQSVADAGENFGTMMQYIKAAGYLGKRVKMSAYVKTKDVKNWSGIWMRVDQEGSEQYLSFDNMYNRPIKGATDWTKYEIVLDVPAAASNIAFGELLNGTGQVWIDNVSFEVVDASVPATGSNDH